MPRRLRAVELRLQTLQLLLLACCCNRLGARLQGDKQVYVLPCHRPRSIGVGIGSVVGRSTEASFDDYNGGFARRNKTRRKPIEQRVCDLATVALLTLQQEGRR